MIYWDWYGSFETRLLYQMVLKVFVAVIVDYIFFQLRDIKPSEQVLILIHLGVTQAATEFYLRN